MGGDLCLTIAYGVVLKMSDLLKVMGFSNIYDEDSLSFDKLCKEYGIEYEIFDDEVMRSDHVLDIKSGEFEYSKEENIFLHSRKCIRSSGNYTSAISQDSVGAPDGPEVSDLQTFLLKYFPVAVNKIHLMFYNCYWV